MPTIWIFTTTEENIKKGFESYIAQINEKGKLIYKLGLNPEIPRMWKLLPIHWMIHAQTTMPLI